VVGIGQVGLILLFITIAFEEALVPDKAPGSVPAKVVLNILELLPVAAQFPLEELDGAPDVGVFPLHMHNDFKAS
jgi:hypothetical protein